MEQYTVTGMSCAACSARVEKAVSKVPGVTSCAVSLLTNSMGVEGTASEAEIVKAVTDAGYGASKRRERPSQAEAGKGGARQGIEEASGDGGEMLADHETPILKRRLAASLVFWVALMYLSMGHMMWNWPVPAWLEHNHIGMGLVQMLLTIAVMVINQKFFISGAKSLLHRAPNMDALVALGSGAAFIYSAYALFAMTDARASGDSAAVMAYMHEFYFESAATILTLITVGKMLEAHSKGKTTDALKGLIKLAPKAAMVIREDGEMLIPASQVKKGDIFVVRPGESIPVDGIVIEGNSAVNEAALTGESIPADKEPGAQVFAATLNQSGFLKCEAVRVGGDTTLSQIIRMVSDAAATKAPIAKVADRVSGVFVPAVIAIAAATILIWLLFGESMGFALARGISVLVISCPCALGLATPVAIMVGNGVGARNGILFKTAASLEEAGKIEIVALDKTGTITSGEPKVTDILPAEGIKGEELLSYAHALEKKSEHPLAKAILSLAGENGGLAKEVTDFAAFPGNGLSGILEGEKLAGGNLRFIQNVLSTSGKENFREASGETQIKTSPEAGISPAVQTAAGQLSEEGKTPLFFAKENQFLGMIAVADVIKEESPQAVRELKNMGIRVVMLTGDNERTAKAIGRQAGVDEVIAGVLPDGKESVIRSLQEKGKTAMVGDGINDAPALTRADIGIAIGAGTDIAIDAADVVLMKSRLSDVPAAIRLSRAALRNIHENLFWAFFYNVIGIPLAAGVWIPLFHWQLNPMFAAAAMSLSSFCVVTNALRLNLARIYDTRRDGKGGKSRQDGPGAQHKQGGQDKQDRQEKQDRQDKQDIQKNQMEEKKMTKTLQIEGMMCGHCEARVKKALEAMEQVAEAVVSHESGTAVVTLQAEASDEELKNTVEAQDYKVIAIG